MAKTPKERMFGQLLSYLRGAIEAAVPEPSFDPEEVSFSEDRSGPSLKLVAQCPIPEGHELVASFDADLQVILMGVSESGEDDCPQHAVSQYFPKSGANGVAEAAGLFDLYGTKRLSLGETR